MGLSRLTRTGLAISTIAALTACAETGTPDRFVNPDASLAAISTPGDGLPNHELFEVCKVYTEGSGPDVTIDVTGPGGTTQATLSSGECENVFISGASVNITVTEHVPAGYTASYVKSTIVSGVVTTDPSAAGNSASGTIGGAPPTGVLVTFTNTLIPPPPPGEGRMTGGGFSVDAGFKVTGGFTIHCDITLSNNIEINWPGNKWHLTKPITSAICIDDPNVDHGPPAAPFDTFIGEGLGELNGVPGYLIQFTFVDAGEPGKNDLATIKIFPPGGGAAVLDFGPLNVTTGNLQAHYDQPHGNKP